MRRGSASPFGSVCEWAMPLVRSAHWVLWAKGRTGGKARWLTPLTGEAEPRLTSGGKADTTEFLCKASVIDDRLVPPQAITLPLENSQRAAPGSTGRRA